MKRFSPSGNLMTKTSPIQTPDRITGKQLVHRLAMTGLMLAALAGGHGTRAATLEPEQLESREGYYQLQWAADEPVRLVVANDPEFTTPTTVYSGSDTGHVASGKPNGVWYYRLESADGTRILSNTAQITVRHHSLRRAFTFFALGAAVFLSTLGLIVFARPDGDERS